MDETLHVAYKKYKIKIKFTFFLVNIKYFLSCELKTSEFSLVLRTCENSDFFQQTQNIFGIHLKKVNILYVLHSFSISVLLACGVPVNGMHFQSEWKTVWILVRLLCQKPAD